MGYRYKPTETTTTASCWCPQADLKAISTNPTALEDIISEDIIFPLAGASTETSFVCAFAATNDGGTSLLARTRRRRGIWIYHMLCRFPLKQSRQSLEKIRHDAVVDWSFFLWFAMRRPTAYGNGLHGNKHKTSSKFDCSFSLSLFLRIFIARTTSCWNLLLVRRTMFSIVIQPWF